MKMTSLQDLFVEELRDVYNAEKQILKALPKMARTAESTDLKEAFESHLEETQHQVERLEQVFEQMGARARGKTCAAMEGMIEEGKDLMSEDAEAEVMDAGLIGAAQKVEHYEIATYGTLVTWARQLGHSKAARLLEETLNEEKAADQKLTRIAEAWVNRQAAAPTA